MKKRRLIRVEVEGNLHNTTSRTQICACANTNTFNCILKNMLLFSCSLTIQYPLPFLWTSLLLNLPCQRIYIYIFFLLNFLCLHAVYPYVLSTCLWCILNGYLSSLGLVSFILIILSFQNSIGRLWWQTQNLLEITSNKLKRESDLYYENNFCN